VIRMIPSLMRSFSGAWFREVCACFDVDIRVDQHAAAVLRIWSRKCDF
jgi:hypothetical protein